MENKTIYYDGSLEIINENNTNSVEFSNEPIVVTDEARKNMGGNPFLTK
ncbi:hypothetical protein R4Z09_15660 [Niallia oryzisoli]|uniref:Uncharacterized protein n=1 Tax=Niallia oryzisoli TaxID=1737571 RepID=A0ABZ2CA03_9BACI